MTRAPALSKINRPPGEWNCVFSVVVTGGILSPTISIKIPKKKQKTKTVTCAVNKSEGRNDKIKENFIWRSSADRNKAFVLPYSAALRCVPSIWHWRAAPRLWSCEITATLLGFDTATVSGWLLTREQKDSLRRWGLLSSLLNHDKILCKGAA